MQHPGHARKQSESSRSPEYEAPRLVVIGPLERITLGALSQNGDTGGVSGFRNTKS